MRPIHLASTSLVVALLMSTACSGEERSEAAFCRTFEEEAVRLHDKYADRARTVGSSDDPLVGLLVGLGSLVEAQGDLAVLFDKLERVSPEEIRSEVAAVRDSIRSQLDSAGDAASDPLGSLGGALVSGLAAMGSVTSVESFVQANCDLSFMSRR